jgi:hypothetical protein
MLKLLSLTGHSFQKKLSLSPEVTCAPDVEMQKSEMENTIMEQGEDPSLAALFTHALPKIYTVV